MNDLQHILFKIDQMTAPIRQFTDRLNNNVPPYIQKLNQTITPFVKSLDAITKAYAPYFAQINVTLVKVAQAARKWQADRKTDVVFLADNGWYPNWFTFFFVPEKESNTVDELMSAHLIECWDEITDKMIELCPNRAHILKNAFELHKSGNYTAAIPLFFAQADGICCESLKSFLFTGNTTEEKIKELIENGKIEATMLTEIFLEPFKLRNHHNVGISKSNQLAKKKAPNRNGILHGHRKHLDYGTEINSLKCFSLLSFIVYVTKELIKKPLEIEQEIKNITNEERAAEEQ